MDLMLFDEESDEIRSAKVSTTLDAPDEGCLAATDRAGLARPSLPSIELPSG
ncbi:hypothetical protein [Sphingobium sp. SCG-1]|uniref:hypothetical protein n=1 Tax=Sphingobium sp. SCG-1 TaxID=2072936 RepID=UPI00166FA017|nr:hypothetical protein [Sphingobium sp. SCG-1]